MGALRSIFPRLVAAFIATTTVTSSKALSCRRLQLITTEKEISDIIRKWPLKLNGALITVLVLLLLIIIDRCLVFVIFFCSCFLCEYECVHTYMYVYVRWSVISLFVRVPPFVSLYGCEHHQSDPCFSLIVMEQKIYQGDGCVSSALGCPRLVGLGTSTLWASMH